MAIVGTRRRLCLAPKGFVRHSPLHGMKRMSNSGDNSTVRSQIRPRFQPTLIACILTLISAATAYAQHADSATPDTSEQTPGNPGARGHASLPSVNPTSVTGQPSSTEAAPPEAAHTDSANVRISTDPHGAHVLMDGALIGVAPVTVRLPVGAHQVRVMSAGYRSQELDFRVSAAQPLTKLFVSLQIDRATTAPDSTASEAPEAYSPHAQGDPRQTLLRHIGTAGVAAGVLVLGGALVLEVMRNQAATSARQEPEQIRFAQALDRTHSRQTWARVLAGTGGVLTALGVTLLVISRGASHATETESASDTSGAHVALACGPGECSAQLLGAF